jgi:hypothetical protein
MRLFGARCVPGLSWSVPFSLASSPKPGVQGSVILTTRGAAPPASSWIMLALILLARRVFVYPIVYP